jgi:hypothetical protein
MVRALVGRLGRKAEGDSGPGVLLSSGLIAGGSIAGIGLALLSLSEGAARALDLSAWGGAFAASALAPLLPLLLVGALLAWQGLKKSVKAV